MVNNSKEVENTTLASKIFKHFKDSSVKSSLDSKVSNNLVTFINSLESNNQNNKYILTSPKYDKVVSKADSKDTILLVESFNLESKAESSLDSILESMVSLNFNLHSKDSIVLEYPNILMFISMTFDVLLILEA